MEQGRFLRAALQRLRRGRPLSRLLIFGLGYTASRIAARARGLGWEVHATGSAGELSFDDEASVQLTLDRSTHLLSSVPPAADGDPVLTRYGDALARHRGWLGYLSSTGVYGDAGGAWVDESAPIDGRRGSRNRADADWLELGARVFRLPGIYGPDRSALDRVAQRKAHKVDQPGQVFSRIHVNDIAAGVVAAFDAPAGAYNLADDRPGPQNDVIDFACSLLGVDSPPTVGLDKLSAEARAFYGENRRVANGKARRVLGWAPRFPSYVEGLRAVNAMARPSSASSDPITASSVHA